MICFRSILLMQWIFHLNSNRKSSTIHTLFPFVLFFARARKIGMRRKWQCTVSTVIAFRSQSVCIIYDHCVFLISAINTHIKETVNYCVYIKCGWFTLDRFSDGTMIKCPFNEHSWSDAAKTHECFRIVSLEHDGVETKKKMNNKNAWIYVHRSR